MGQRVRPGTGWEGPGEAKARVGAGRTKPGRRQGRSVKDCPGPRLGARLGSTEPTVVRTSRMERDRERNGKDAGGPKSRWGGPSGGRGRRTGRRAERGAGRTSPELAMSRAGRAAASGARDPGPPAWLARDAQSRRVRGSTETGAGGGAICHFRRPPIRTSARPRAGSMWSPCWMRHTGKAPLGRGLSPRGRADPRLLSGLISRSAHCMPLCSRAGPSCRPSTLLPLGVCIRCSWCL